MKTIRLAFASIGLACAVALSTGCASAPLKLTPAQQELKNQLAAIHPPSDPLPQNTEIIDVHTHTFNARYLPLRGILLGKRDAFPPFTTLISDNCAINIARTLIELTELEPSPTQPGAAANTNITKEIRETAHPGLVCRIFLKLIEKAIAKGVWKEETTAEKMQNLDRKMRTLDEIANQMTIPEKLAVKSVMKMMGMETYAKSPKVNERMLNDYQAAIRFVWTLTQNDALIAPLYQHMHAGSLSKGPIKMISHMMDLGPVYDQPAEGQTLLDFGKDQVQRMERYQNEPGSPLSYFVAYNPYRSYQPGSGTNDAIQLVKDAIQHHGAKGVKVYPPSGYRPADNDIKSRPCALFTRYPGIQWDKRYLGLGPDMKRRNKKLDEELENLLLWCIDNDVPVLVHSAYGEFQARKGYGVHHSNPIFWKKFLEKHNTNGPCKLRLCLGHAGGEDYWFGSGKFAEWGRTAYELCTNYPNVYCEITTSGAMINPDSQAFFADRITTLTENSAQSPFPFMTKLLYGTDWPLPDKGEPRDILRATQSVFLLPRLREHYADYFSDNARRYLKLGAPENP